MRFIVFDKEAAMIARYSWMMKESTAKMKECEKLRMCILQLSRPRRIV